MDVQRELTEQAFGAMNADARGVWLQRMEHAVEGGTAFGAFDGDRGVGGAVFFDMRQWWCGRAVPMAGVGNVQVAPEERGRGTGRAMMTRVLDEIAARGFPLSVLSPATMPIYRSLGWELGGGRYAVAIPSRSLRDLIPPDIAAGSGRSAIRRVGPADAQTTIDVMSRIHEAARHCGPITWDATGTAINLARPGYYSYLCDDGFLAYRWYNGNDEMFVERMQAASADALRGLAAVISSHASIVDSVQGWINPADPIWWLTRERDATIRSRKMWMLRVVDAPAAIAARGFPPAVSMRTQLSIVDQSRPANSGSWMLSVTNGKGELAAVAASPAQVGRAQASPAQASSALTLGPRGLAALYAGTPVVSLRLAGLAVGGDPDADAALDAAFSANAYILDTF